MQPSDHPSSQELHIPDAISLKALADLRAERLVDPVVKELGSTIDTILQISYPVHVVQEPFSPFLEFRMQDKENLLLGKLKVQEVHSTSEAGRAMVRYQTVYSFFEKQDTATELRQQLIMEAGYYLRKEKDTLLWSDVYKLTEGELVAWEYLTKKGLAKKSTLTNAAGQPMYKFLG